MSLTSYRAAPPRDILFSGLSYQPGILIFRFRRPEARGMLHPAIFFFNLASIAGALLRLASHKLGRPVGLASDLYDLRLLIPFQFAPSPYALRDGIDTKKPPCGRFVSKIDPPGVGIFEIVNGFFVI